MSTAEAQKNAVRQEMKDIESDLVSLETSIRNANACGDYKWVHEELLPLRDTLYKRLAAANTKYGDLISAGGKK